MEEILKREYYGYVSDTHFIKKANADKVVSYSMSQAASILAIKGVGRNKLYAKLKDMIIINQANEAYSEYVVKGFFVNQKIFSNRNVLNKVMVTQKGLEYLQNILY